LRKHCNLKSARRRDSPSGLFWEIFLCFYCTCPKVLCRSYRSKFWHRHLDSGTPIS